MSGVLSSMSGVLGTESDRKTQDMDCIVCVCCSTSRKQRASWEYDLEKNTPNFILQPQPYRSCYPTTTLPRGSATETTPYAISTFTSLSWRIPNSRFMKLKNTRKRFWVSYPSGFDSMCSGGIPDVNIRGIRCVVERARISVGKYITTVLVHF
jgi:hypothetical protein